MRRAIAQLIVVIICFAAGSLKTDAIAQSKSLQEQLLGSWILVSNFMERADGTKVDLFGTNPKGILIFAADGRFSTLVARADLPKLASANRGRTTPEESKAVVEGSLAYYGTYSVNDLEKVVTVRIEGSTFVNQVGAVQKRVITSMTADEITVTNPASTSGGAIHLVWRRAK